jgi:hypothetical protein
VPIHDGARIEWRERCGDSGSIHQVTYTRSRSQWQITDGNSPQSYSHGTEPHQTRPIVVYLRVDGGVSVRDSLRVGPDSVLPFGLPAFSTGGTFQFRESEIWDGLDPSGDKRSTICEGFIRDVSRWSDQAESKDFDQLAEIVEKLAGQEPFRLIRKSQRVSMDDARDFPMIAGPSGEMPVSQAPAGLRRILGLAYIIVWSWREHKIAARLMNRPITNSIVILIDEVESHLHPRWQRTILPCLLRCLGPDVQVQVLASTHSPMVLASLEPHL